jgi:hypothetical protein
MTFQAYLDNILSTTGKTSDSHAMALWAVFKSNGWTVATASAAKHPEAKGRAK